MKLVIEARGLGLLYIYIYDHSSSDKEIDGRGPGRGEKANEEAFEDDGSMKRRAILFHRHLIVMNTIIEYNT